jgi:hypothetical protein
MGGIVATPVDPEYFSVRSREQMVLQEDGSFVYGTREYKFIRHKFLGTQREWEPIGFTPTPIQLNDGSLAYLVSNPE